MVDAGVAVFAQGAAATAAATAVAAMHRQTFDLFSCGIIVVLCFCVCSGKENLAATAAANCLAVG